MDASKLCTFCIHEFVIGCGEETWLDATPIALYSSLTDSARLSFMQRIQKSKQESPRYQLQVLEIEQHTRAFRRWSQANLPLEWSWSCVLLSVWHGREEMVGRWHNYWEQFGSDCECSWHRSKYIYEMVLWKWTKRRIYGGFPVL